MGCPNARTFRATRLLTGMASASGPMPLLRVRLIAGSVSILALAGTGVLALAAIFSHQAVLATAAHATVVICVFANGVIEAWRSYFLWYSGAWGGLGGQRLTREQQPTRFLILLALHLLLAVIWMSAAGYLAWALLQRL